VGHQKFIGDNLRLLVLGVVSLASGFAVQLLAGYFFGASADRDAYFIALSVPFFLTSVLTNSVSVVMLPAIVRWRLNPDFNGEAVVNGALLTAGLLIGVIFLTAAAAASQITTILAPSVHEEGRQVIVNSMRILCAGFAFQSVSIVFSSLFHLANRFTVPALQPLFSSGFSLASMVLFQDNLGILSLAWGYSVGCAAHSISLFFFTPIGRTLGMKRIYVGLELRDMFLRSAPLVGSGVVSKSVPLMERHFASSLAQGSVTYLGYSSLIIQALSTLTSGSLATVVFPKLSQMFVRGDLDGVRILISKSLRVILGISAPVALSVICFGEDLAETILEYGEFRHQDGVLVLEVLVISLGHYVFTSLGSVMGRALYGTGQVLTVGIIGIVEVFAYLFMIVLFLGDYGAPGLAAALSISSGIAVGIQLVWLSRKVKENLLRSAVQDALRLAVSAGVCILPFVVVLMYIAMSPWIVSFVIIPMYFCLFVFVCARALRIEEAGLALEFVWRFVKRIVHG
jgi:putative peptidoglycan lipid II flippase